MLDITELCVLQKELDDRIQTKFGLTYGETNDRKKIALLVEIGELANELRSFKYWSVKGPSAKDVIVEELSDCIHFILSFKIANGDNQMTFNYDKNDLDVNETILELYKQVINYQYDDQINKIIITALTLANKIGVSANDILAAYKAKNAKNHQRQENNY